MYPDNKLKISDYNFSDLINIKEFKKILDGFYKATNIPNKLISNNGELISQSGWTEISEGNLSPYFIPIIVEKYPIATLLLDQNLIEGSKQKSNKQTASISEDKIKYLIEFITNTAKILAQCSLSKIEHNKIEQRNKSNEKILKMIARGENLSDILYEVIKTVESEDLTSICSILLLDKDEEHLLNNIKNRLPQFYNDAINGVKIGIGVGSCGTAAFLKERVIIEDIMTNKYWKSYKRIAKKANLASCWSEPIISSNTQILGTFAIYHSTINKPNDCDLERISFAANIASIAIENNNNREKLEFQAYTDYLTGLKNRRAFIEQAQTELYRSTRYDRKFSLIMFDIDYFKRINDTFGHSVGDLVLQEIANICKTILREVDIIGRIGGEEFAILLPETDIQEATQVAQRLCDAISNGEISTPLNKKPKFTASFGVVFADKLNLTTIDDLLNQADNILYQAKKAGRNKVCISR